MSTMNSEPVNEADWGRVAPVLDAAIDQLSESDRTAVLLRFVDRRPFSEIGAVLRLTEDAARMRIDRALDKLRLLLKRRGIISSTAALEAAMATHAVSAAPAGLAINVAGTALASGPATLAAGERRQIAGAAKFATGIAVVLLRRPWERPADGSDSSARGGAQRRESRSGGRSAEFAGAHAGIPGNGTGLKGLFRRPDPTGGRGRPTWEHGRSRRGGPAVLGGIPAGTGNDPRSREDAV